MTVQVAAETAAKAAAADAARDSLRVALEAQLAERNAAKRVVAAAEDAYGRAVVNDAEGYLAACAREERDRKGKRGRGVSGR